MPVCFGDMLTEAFHGTCWLTEGQRVEGGMFALDVCLLCAEKSFIPLLSWDG